MPHQARLHFKELILGAQKTVPDRIPEDFFFSSIFQRNFSQERGFGGVAGIPVFLLLQDFLQEFLRDRNFCIYSGFLQNPEDSSRFLIPPIAVWLGQRLKKALW